MAIIEADDINVTLGGLPILRSVTLSVEPGEAVALLGANGSGKTTLMRALLGLYPLSHGEVKLFGTELSHFRQWNRLGYVPQRASVKVPQATVREIVSTGVLSSLKPFQHIGKREKARIDGAIEEVGLEQKANQPIKELSGGQQQRALIARALAGHPELLMMDEPFAGVDLDVQASLAELLGKLKKQGKTLLIVLHELGAMRSVLDRAVSLRGGRVLAGVDETHAHHETEPVEEPDIFGREGLE
ncbi:MAG: metal ABC transporter ATP-binding protein [Propionibacteriaceae bacterium]|jgi:zinc transport system ATP-binding protein|nr:metal ABC transporter ATP-binding protein [Propionibacteriaceae bacterium]